MTAVRFCRACGAARIEGARFCGQCGANLDALPAEVAVARSEPQAATPLVPGPTPVPSMLGSPARMDAPPPASPPAPEVAAGASLPPTEPDYRALGEENLSSSVREAMAKGWSPGYADGRSAVLYRGTKISHWLHALLSWPLAFWFWYWVYITVRHGGVHQLHLIVQHDGSVTAQVAREATPKWVYLMWVALAAFQIWFALAVFPGRLGASTGANPPANEGVYLPGIVSPSPAPPTQAPAVGVPSQVSVPALDATGVAVGQVQNGDLLTVSVSGTWCMGGSGATAECGTAAGIRSTHPNEPAALLPSAMIGTLIGRVGSGPWFAIGASGTFTADRSGTLVLMFNDIPGGYGDNSRSVAATISVTR
jgi:PA-IL-like protein